MRKDRRTKMTRKVSKIGSYAIASSIRDHPHHQPCITCTTFNILAPIYKRLNHKDQSCRESDYRDDWLDRNQRILDSLLYERSSIICLQEFWLGNEELVNMYEKRLSDAGYLNFKLGRTNNRGDGLLTALQKDCFRVINYRELLFNDFGDRVLGLLTALHKDCFRVINYRELLFNDFGDRVAQLLHVELTTPASQYSNNDICQELLIVNTHLLFPHDSSFCIVRLHQVYKILHYAESYQKEHKLNPLPIILCGDWNGSKRGHVYKFLRSQGFVSSYDTAHRYTDADAHKWVSHLNHRGNVCGVDFIWLLNPNRYRKLLKTSWSEAVFGMFKNQLRKASLTEEDAFAFLKADNDGDYITYSGFCEALRQLNITGHRHGPSVEETKDLWVQADIDGNGVVDKNEFQQRIWNPSWSEQRDEQGVEAHDRLVANAKYNQQQAIGFSVNNAVLFPPEVEKGRWPENYSLSDHARLTVVFSPIKMPCSKLTS